MPSLLTLDPSTLFFHNLCLTRIRQSQLLDNWLANVATSLKPGRGGRSARSTSTTQTAPSLTVGSTHSSSSSKRQASVIDLSGPTPKKPKTTKDHATAPKLQSKSKSKSQPAASVKVAVKAEVADERDLGVDGDDGGYDMVEVHLEGGLSDHEEMQGEEQSAALASPIKSGARATSSVSTLVLNYN